MFFGAIVVNLEVLSGVGDKSESAVELSAAACFLQPDRFNCGSSEFKCLPANMKPV